MKPEERAFLDGLLEAFDDLPDGAWQAACEEMIALQKEFAGRDPNEVFMEWASVDDEEEGR